jgi:uncharacterized membrane protein YphA (DoxX/SURF4 family)
MTHSNVQTDVNNQKFSGLQSLLLLMMRFFIGWHFLYEGIIKLIDPEWSSVAYLAQSKWLFSGIFNWITESPGILTVVDLLNVWGLIFIGTGLILGIFTRWASLSGMLLLALYYTANPPFIQTGGMSMEGNYLFIDKNLVEFMALGVLAAMPLMGIPGLERLFNLMKAGKKESSAGDGDLDKPKSLPRRELIRSLSGVPVLAGFSAAAALKLNPDSWEEKNLLGAGGVDTVSSATLKTFHYAELKDLKGKLPFAKIGDMELSRMFMGGNLIGGWAHARDLIYVSKLIKTYHSDEKVFETLHLGERCGLNTILTTTTLSRVINRYWKERGGSIQFISDCAGAADLLTGIQSSIDGGAQACYVQGGIGDQLAAEGRTDEIGKALDFIRKNGLPAGIGGHKIETIQACVEAGLKPDFWVKTLHRNNYWSARTEEEYNDNCWCLKPDETISYMNEREEPWIAFKVLAAGAIDPAEGIKFAFDNGADFVCLGMYDFQVVEDTNIAWEIFNQGFDRTRPWRA